MKTKTENTTEKPIPLTHPMEPAQKEKLEGTHMGLKKAGEKL